MDRPGLIVEAYKLPLHVLDDVRGVNHGSSYSDCGDTLLYEKTGKIQSAYIAGIATTYAHKTPSALVLQARRPWQPY